MQAARGGF